MRISSPRLRRLDNALASLPAESDAMLLGELDGYLAGVIVCPGLIPPSDWLPAVWSTEGKPAPFEDEREAQWYVALIMEHYNAIIRALDKPGGGYRPFLEIDRRHDETVWEMWSDGFAVAMELRPDSWARIAEDGDVPATEALAGMISLADIARDTSDLDRATIDTLTEQAPTLIPRWVATLHAWRRSQAVGHAPMIETAPTAKPGRNERCSCGSGKKYKMCCGRH